MYETLATLAPDPILGLIGSYRADENPDKVDLGAGVFRDASGHTPIPAAVKIAEQRWLESETTKGYLGQAGVAGFNDAIESFLFGADHPARRDGRVRTVQTPGGSGALSVAAGLIRRTDPQARLLVSEPTWDNHVPLLSSAGLELARYRYYDYSGNALDFAGMCEALSAVPRGTPVLLHGCCHNPCGADLSPEQWDKVADIALKTGFLPFIDIAYHGLALDPDQDAYGVRLLAERLPEILVAYSCSKNFGLYRDRCGAISVVGASARDADAALSHVLSVARAMYSMPPTHGPGIVLGVLEDAELRDSWLADLVAMRERLTAMRVGLSAALAARSTDRDFGYIARQFGMFSFLGLDEQQVQQLRERYSIYVVPSSRMSVTGLNAGNLDYVADAIAAVL
ncbi:MAG: aspartate/tyrosine/aromatic aminotransferase [Gammaproteobacteria bacterium]|nr:aspartate/tyrosine/aromatic aminotransferase [Gammaproteobacteria bacterium]